MINSIIAKIAHHVLERKNKNGFFFPEVCLTFNFSEAFLYAHLDKALLTPGTIIPEGRIHGPAATIAYFVERANMPGLLDLPAAPRTITHEAHQLSVTVFTLAMITYPLCLRFGGRIEPRAVTPRAEAPLRQNTPMATRAYMAKRRVGIESVPIASAPRAYQHTFCDRLGAIDALEDSW